MHTENVIFIQADPARIFRLAADIEDWPTILPHYRWVTVFERSDDGNRKVVEMAAVRPDLPVRGARFPVRWRSVQICEPDAGRIIFKHYAGVAIGMWVEWEIAADPAGRGTRVAIRHDLRYPLMFLNGLFAEKIVGEGFVGAIAGRTLATIKKIAESEELRCEE
jgi:hypothetical protein